MPASWSSFLRKQESKPSLSPARHACFLVVIPAEARIQAVLVARPSCLPLACHSCGSMNPGCSCRPVVMPASWSSFLRKQESRLFLSPVRLSSLSLVIPAEARIQAVPVARPSCLLRGRHSCGSRNPGCSWRPSVVPASWSSFLRKQESRLFLSPVRHACFVVVIPAEAGIQAVLVARPSCLLRGRHSCGSRNPGRPCLLPVIPASRPSFHRKATPLALPPWQAYPSPLGRGAGVRGGLFLAFLSGRLPDPSTSRGSPAPHP